MLIFEILGKPIPQQHTRWKNGRAYNPNAVDIERIRWQISPHAPQVPLTGPIEVDFTFYMPIPKSTSSIRKRQMANALILPITRPDVDNLGYLVTNALKSLIYADDAQIVDLHLHKRYGHTPKTICRIVEIENSIQTPRF